MEIVCPQCGNVSDKPAGALGRAKKLGSPIYCSRTCAGIARREKNPPSQEERKARKAAYDKEYRKRDPEALKARKAEYYRKTRDPEKERIRRKENMHKHVAYCRTDEYRVKKKAYDAERRFKAYGPFEDVARLLDQVEKEIASQASRYEIYKAKGYFTRSAIQRRRELWQQIKRN